MDRALDEVEQQERLGEVPGWVIDSGALGRTFTFSNFVAAFGFMASAALVAESMNHHPEWSNVYNKVTVRLSSHEVNGITNLDFELAAKMSDLAGSSAES